MGKRLTYERTLVSPQQLSGYPHVSMHPSVCISVCSRLTGLLANFNNLNELRHGYYVRIYFCHRSSLVVRFRKRYGPLNDDVFWHGDFFMWSYTICLFFFSFPLAIAPAVNPVAMYVSSTSSFIHSFIDEMLPIPSLIIASSSSWQQRCSYVLSVFSFWQHCFQYAPSLSGSLQNALTQHPSSLVFFT